MFAVRAKEKDSQSSGRQVPQVDTNHAKACVLLTCPMSLTNLSPLQTYVEGAIDIKEVDWGRRCMHA